MSDVIIGLSAVVIVFVLVLVLAMQFQIRNLSEKLDKILDKID